MNSANRKAKFSNYEVIVTREVNQTITLIVEARNAEEAQDVARASADGVEVGWKSNTLAIYAKAIKLRGVCGDQSPNGAARCDLPKGHSGALHQYGPRLTWEVK